MNIKCKYVIIRIDGCTDEQTKTVKKVCITFTYSFRFLLSVVQCSCVVRTILLQTTLLSLCCIVCMPITTKYHRWTQIQIINCLPCFLFSNIDTQCQSLPIRIYGRSIVQRARKMRINLNLCFFSMVEFQFDFMSLCVVQLRACKRTLHPMLILDATDASVHLPRWVILHPIHRGKRDKIAFELSYPVHFQLIDSAICVLESIQLHEPSKQFIFILPLTIMNVHNAQNIKYFIIIIVDYCNGYQRKREHKPPFSV